MNPSYEEYLEGTLKILKEGEKEKKKYYIDFLGKKFIVYPNVFSPKYFKDSEFFVKEMPIKKGEEFLEIGSGTGIISIFAVLKGASKVVSIDINKDAVANTRENARIHKVDSKVTVLRGDVYGPLPKDSKFDTIFWNTPFGYIENENISILERSVKDPYYKSTKAFISGAKKFLKPNGHLLIGFSTTLGKFEIIEKYLLDAGFEVKLLKEIKSKEFYPVKFEIFEAKPLI